MKFSEMPKAPRSHFTISVNNYGNEREKRNVSRRVSKMLTNDADLTWVGRLFQRRWPATGNAWMTMCMLYAERQYKTDVVDAAGIRAAMMKSFANMLSLPSAHPTPDNHGVPAYGSDLLTRRYLVMPCLSRRTITASVRYLHELCTIPLSRPRAYTA